MQSIKQKILLVTLLPSSVLIMAISAYLLTTRIDELEKNFNDRGEAIADQIANSAIHDLFKHNFSALERMARRDLNSHPDTQRIKISDSHHLLIVDVIKSGEFSVETVDPTTIFTSKIKLAISPNSLYTLPLDEPQLLHTGNTDNIDIGEVSVWLYKDHNLKPREELISTTILLAFVGLFFTALLANYLSNLLAKPIEELTDAAKMLRKGAGPRVEPSQTGEIGELQYSFNSMAEDIATANVRMKSQVTQATHDLQEGLHELETKNIELDIAHSKAVDAMKAKSEFLAHMSHEIRTPMNGIIGFTNLLGKTNIDVQQQEYVSTIEASAHNLLSIINDILDLSKLEAEKLQLEHVPLSLRKCVDSIVSLFTPMAHDKNLELVAHVYSDVPDRLIGDQTRFNQIITNLLNNAIKFTKHGYVTIRIMLDEDHYDHVQLIIEVADSGIGISENEQKSIFDAFSQATNQQPKTITGTGLGLNITRRLIKAMQGSITVKSELGKGALFETNILLKKDMSIAKKSYQELCNEPAFKHTKILLLEPFEASRVVLNFQISTMGCEVKEINDYADLLSYIRSDFALLVVALNAKALASTYINKMLEKFMSDSKVPVLMLVGTSDQNCCNQYLAEGAVACHPKPIKQLLLNTIISNLLLPNTKIGEIAAQHYNGDTNEQYWLKNKTVLVADDNATNLLLMRHLLNSFGAIVITAKDGQQAVDKAMNEPLDLVLLDIHMPQLNGFEAAKKLHVNLQITPPIIALTADAMPENMQEIKRQGFDGYLTKPIDEARFKSMICNLLNIQSSAQATSATGKKPLISKNKPPVVHDKIHALKISGGSETLANSFFTELKKNLPDDLATFHHLFDKQDWSSLWDAVHHLHGTVAVCAVPAMLAVVEQLQKDIQHKDCVSVAQGLNAMKIEFNRLPLEGFLDENS